MMEKAAERLKTLNVHTKDARQNAELFLKSKDMRELRVNLREHGTALGAGQVLHFHFKRLVERHPEVLDGVGEELAHTGVSEAHAREYLTLGADGSGIFGQRHQDDYSVETMENFGKHADQFALDRLKRWLAAAK